MLNVYIYPLSRSPGINACSYLFFESNDWGSGRIGVWQIHDKGWMGGWKGELDWPPWQDHTHQYISLEWYFIIALEAIVVGGKTSCSIYQKHSRIIFQLCACYCSGYNFTQYHLEMKGIGFKTIFVLANKITDSLTLHTVTQVITINLGGSAVDFESII